MNEEILKWLAQFEIVQITVQDQFGLSRPYKRLTYEEFIAMCQAVLQNQSPVIPMNVYTD